MTGLCQLPPDTLPETLPPNPSSNRLPQKERFKIDNVTQEKFGDWNSLEVISFIGIFANSLFNRKFAKKAKVLP